jgi:peptide methionine sulfoxide reductase MsrB
MMTRKDYVATAEILNSYASEIKIEVYEDIVNDFSEMFFSDNDKFDSDRFWEECMKNLNVEE